MKNICKKGFVSHNKFNFGIDVAWQMHSIYILFASTLLANGWYIYNTPTAFKFDLFAN